MTTKHFYFDYHYDPRNECCGNNFNERDNYFIRSYDNKQDYAYNDYDYSNFNNRDYNNYDFDKHDFNYGDNDFKKNREERNRFVCFCRQHNCGWKEYNHDCKQKEQDLDCDRDRKQNCSKKERHSCNCFRCRFKYFFKCW